MKTLVVISASYPYSVGEDFVYKELKEAEKYYDQILLYPLTRDEHPVRWVPEKCIVSDLLINPPASKSQGMSLMLSVYLTELLKSGKFSFVLKNFRSLFASIKQCKQKSELLLADLAKYESAETHFYSVWMNDGALIFSMLKKQQKITNNFFRLHGYDLFDERRAGNYMPFRTFNFKYANRVFVLSQAGLDYVKAKNVYPEKLICNYSGLYDHGEGPFDEEGVFTLVSCSSLKAFKRVDRIIETLKEIEFPVRWYHLGDGDELERLKTLAKDLPPHVEAKFKGRLSNPDVLEFYKKHSVNLFIQLSETEGLGMSAVEAQSFGIPALSLDVGGVKEVVNEETGILLPPTTSIEELKTVITSFKNSTQNSIQFRQEVRGYFLTHFESVNNYQYFYNLIAKYAKEG